MRLLHVDTFEIRMFSENDVPEYAILSHTWGADEVTYQELSLITRMRSMSEMFDADTTTTFRDGVTSNTTPLMLAAIEILVRGNWSPGMNLPNASDDALMKRYGYSKISNSAREAKKLGYQWIWIDGKILACFRYRKHSLSCA